MNTVNFDKVAVISEHTYTTRARHPQSKSLVRQVSFWVPHYLTATCGINYTDVLLNAWEQETDTYYNKQLQTYIMAGVVESRCIQRTIRVTGVVLVYALIDKLDIRKIKRRILKARGQIFC